MKTLKLLFVLSLVISTGLQAQQAQWELVRTGLTGKIAIDPTNSNVIYFAASAALNKSTDGGQTWVKYEQGYEIGNMKGIVIDPNNTQRLWIYGTPFKGIVRSEDGGVTATQADEGISYDHHGYQVTALAYDHVRDILYAGNQANDFGIYRSYDGGKSWEQVSRRIYPQVLMVALDSGWVYCGGIQLPGEEGILRSKDFGTTWQQLNPEFLNRQNIYFLAELPNSRTLYSAALTGEIYKSYDLGEHWIFLVDLTPGNLDALSGGLIVSRFDTNYIYIGRSPTGGPDGTGGFYISPDGGQNWQKYHNGLPDSIFSQWAVFSLEQSQSSEYLYMSVQSRVNSTFKLSQVRLTSVRDSPSSQPHISLLQQNYPNPFNNATKIEFSLKKAQYVTLDINNLAGEKVIRLIERFLEAGAHAHIWNGKNSKGGEMSSGIYFLRLQIGREVFLRKMLLIR